LEQELRHRVEQSEAKTLGIARESAALARGGGDGLELAACVPDDLDPRPVGRSAALLPAAAREHGEVACRLVGELLQQPRLADARLSGDHHEAAASGGGLAECVLELSQLPRP